MRDVFRFPHPVNEVSARLVAAGVVALGLVFVVTGWAWLTVPLAYGFVARVAAGPRFSPLGRLVTGVVTPRLPWEPRLVAGPPKRFAQGIGAVLSVAALVAALGFGAPARPRILVALIVAAASLEAGFGLCIGCKLFAAAARAGLVPASVCAECSDLGRRLGIASTA